MTSFYVGYSDDLGPYEYNQALDSLSNESFSSKNMSSEELCLLKMELANYKPPRIYGGTGYGAGACLVDPPFTTEKVNRCLETTTGFRFMGQRFVPDSYLFQNLVVPSVGDYTGQGEAFTLGPNGRHFPRGLDVMALLGSDSAKDILEDLDDSSYQGYSRQFSKIEAELTSGEEDWQKNLYWAWLYALRPLLASFEPGYPSFMQTVAWQDKELTTALASWTELRHDTILYAKQSYEIAATCSPEWGLGFEKPEKPVVGYVEPVPEFYHRLLVLTSLTKDNLEREGLLRSDSVYRLERLEEILGRLEEISLAELENQELSEEDYEFIKDFGSELNGVISSVEDDSKKTTIVADVHTSVGSGQVLEEAVGYVRLVVVAYKVPDGRVLLGAGPIFSYYEFKQPMSDRLTDEAWREMLRTDPPEEPEWVSSFADWVPRTEESGQSSGPNVLDAVVGWVSHLWS